MLHKEHNLCAPSDIINSSRNHIMSRTYRQTPYKKQSAKSLREHRETSKRSKKTNDIDSFDAFFEDLNDTKDE